MTDRGLRIASVAALALGLALMIPFEHAATLALGVACLFAFIVLGLFGFLTPELLSCDPNDAEAPEKAESIRQDPTFSLTDDDGHRDEVGRAAKPERKM